MQNLVSIIIPAYNMGDLVKSCINSVLNQTYSNYEIIIVNDGSKDNTEAVCAEFAKANPNIFLFTQENQGVSVARNNGMKSAKGDYILFLDADDTIPPNALNDLMETAKKYDSDMTMGKISPNEQIPIGVFSNDEFLIKCLENNPITYYSVRTLYKREFLSGIYFEKGYVCSEDSYFIFECAIRMPKVATIPECVYSYNVNVNSVTRSAFTRKRYDSICKLIEKKEAVIAEKFPEYLELFYHLKTKTQMMLLTNLASVKGSEFKNEEKETLLRFENSKSYFRAELPYSNAPLFNTLVNKGYKKYKRQLRTKLLLKRILRR